MIDTKEGDTVSTKRLRYDYIEHVSDGLTNDNKLTVKAICPGREDDRLDLRVLLFQPEKVSNEKVDL